MSGAEERSVPGNGKKARKLQLAARRGLGQKRRRAAYMNEQKKPDSKKTDIFEWIGEADASTVERRISTDAPPSRQTPLHLVCHPMEECACRTVSRRPAPNHDSYVCNAHDLFSLFPPPGIHAPEMQWRTLPPPRRPVPVCAADSRPGLP